MLSLVDERGAARDGFLRLHEIYNLTLSADLVVMSDCQTALGKEVRGEGLVGLTRGFVYAGAARVAASLWRIDDAATAELVSQFYHNMLSQGLRPAAPLRVAQTEMSRQKRWQHPYYWAAFQLQGEWKWRSPRRVATSRARCDRVAPTGPQAGLEPGDPRRVARKALRSPI